MNKKTNPWVSVVDVYLKDLKAFLTEVEQVGREMHMATYGDISSFEASDAKGGKYPPEVAKARWEANRDRHFAAAEKCARQCFTNAAYLLDRIRYNPEKGIGPQPKPKADLHSVTGLPTHPILR